VESTDWRNVSIIANVLEHDIIADGLDLHTLQHFESNNMSLNEAIFRMWFYWKCCDMAVYANIRIHNGGRAVVCVSLMLLLLLLLMMMSGTRMTEWQWITALNFVTSVLCCRPASVDSWDRKRRLDVCLTALCLHLLRRDHTTCCWSH